MSDNKVLADSVDSRIEKHTKVYLKPVIKCRSGWDRFFHPLNWFNPEYKAKELCEEEIEEEIRFISRNKLRNQLVVPIRESLIGEGIRILDLAKEETESIKKYFYAQFEEVDEVLSKKAKELGEAIESKEASEEALVEANCLLRNLDEIRAELETILAI